MKQKLEASVFFRRCAAPKSTTITGDRVVFTFTAALARQDVVKKCAQTFRTYGCYSNYSVVDKGAPAGIGQDGSPGDPISPQAPSAPAPGDTLACRSRVEGVLQTVAGFSTAELHNTIFRITLMYARQVQVSTSGATAIIQAQKTAAAHVFAETPATEWRRLLTEQSAKTMPLEGVTCQCRCGCGVFSGDAAQCLGCRRFCCRRCHPATHVSHRSNAALRPYLVEDSLAFGGWTPRCHDCAKAPKLMSVQLPPPLPVDGLTWYFHAPWEKPRHAMDFEQRPCQWCNPNRDTRLDPPLIDIKEVRKERRLENATRLARPPGWQSAFTVHAVLGGAEGSSAAVHINMFNFMMNQTWRDHPIVKYIRDDWVTRPGNYEYVGWVLNPPALPRAPPSPPSPQSPVHYSSVTIEEVSDEVAEGEPTAPDDEDLWADMEEAIQACNKKRRTAPGLPTARGGAAASSQAPRPNGGTA